MQSAPDTERRGSGASTIGKSTASTMSKLLLSFAVILSSAAAFEWKNISGTYGDTTMLLNVAIGDRVVEIQSHKPDNAPASFRESTNLHVFSRRLVAIKNPVDKECYVRHINLTFDELKDRIRALEQHDPSAEGDISENWIDVKRVCPLEPWAVEELLGDEIDCFCRFHDVYFVGEVHSGDIDLKTISGRRKRAVPPVIIACGCCPPTDRNLAK